MLLKDLFEAVGPETAKNSLISSVRGYQAALRGITLTLRDRADDMKAARRMAGGQKARWVNEKYLSSRRFRDSGLQTTAEYLAANTASVKAKKIFRNLASLKFSAMKDSGKAQIFDQVGNLFTALGSITKDEDLARLFQSLKTDKRAYEVAMEGPVAKPDKTPKQPKRDDLSGAQNQQAEEVFQEIVQSLPKPVQREVRRATSRMGPAEKLAYLRSM